MTPAQGHRLSANMAIRALASDDVVRVATVGDIVALHFTCKGEDGGLLESSYEANEPLSFEVGGGTGYWDHNFIIHGQALTLGLHMDPCGNQPEI